jgi:hypothetical protein
MWIFISNTKEWGKSMNFRQVLYDVDDDMNWFFGVTMKNLHVISRDGDDDDDNELVY